MSRARIVLATTLATALGGCFVEAPADDVGSPLRAGAIGAALGDAPEQAAWRGTYTVPVPVELTDAASFPVTDVAVAIHDHTLTVTFSLPEGLLGYRASATFTGTVGGPDDVEVAITGLAGHGTCRLDHGLDCDLIYYAPTADLGAVADYWRARQEAQVDARVQVASLFEDDPLGVLRLTRD